MKKVLINWSFKNFNKAANTLLTMISGIVGIIAVWNEEVLSVLHEAPFPVSDSVDIWVKWILKISSLALTIITLGSKKQDQLDIKVTKGSY
jgi:hypothetical protein